MRKIYNDVDTSFYPSMLKSTRCWLPLYEYITHHIYTQSDKRAKAMNVLPTYQ